MKAQQMALGLTVLGLGVLVGGCAGSPRRAEIPLGEWRGTGVFVLDRWEAHEQEEHGEKWVRKSLQHGAYPTHLKIARANELGDGAVRMEILSERGEVEDMGGDRTHLLLHLRPDTSLADESITLYRLVDFGLSFDANPPEPDEHPEGLTHASCMLVNGELVLRIHYMDQFVDTLRFRGNTVFKDGSYWADGGDGLIHWSERLERCR